MYYTTTNGNQIVVRNEKGQPHMYVSSGNGTHYISGTTLVVEDNNGHTTIWDLDRRQKIRG